MLPMKCTLCGSTELRTPITNNQLADQTMRKRRCAACGHVWFTVELAVPNYAVGWSLEHKRKPVLRVPLELAAGHMRTRISHVEPKDSIEALHEANRLKSERADRLHSVTDCDGLHT